MSRRYWKEIHVEAWRRTRESGFLEWKRLSTSVGLPIVSGLIQWLTGVSLPLNLAVNIGGGLVLYVFLIFVERYIRTRQVIEEREAIRDQTIASLLEKLDKPAAPPFVGRILELTVGAYERTVSTLRVSALLEIRNLHAPPDMSIHGFCLWYLGSPEHESLPFTTARQFVGRMWRERIEFIFHDITFDEAGRAALSGSKWKASFKDIHDDEYDTEFFEKP